MNRHEWMSQKRQWAREHANEIIVAIQGYTEGYVEMHSDISGAIRDGDDRFVDEFETPQELVEKLNRMARAR